MSTRRAALPLAGLLTGLLHLTATAADPLDPVKVWDLIAHNGCSEARQRIETSDAAAEFLATPEGQCLYAKSLCCSPSAELGSTDIDHALGHIAAARAGFTPLSPPMANWLDDTRAQCEQTQRAISNPEIMDSAELLRASTEVIRVRSHYAGKVMSGCEGRNLSPALVPQHHAADLPGWEYVTPRPAENGVELQPSSGYLEALAGSYVGGPAKVAVCAPFVAVSDSQDPAEICRAAQRFADYFSRTFAARRPPTWVSLVHYAPGDDRLYQHARRTTGDIGCKGVLGYFDWQRQSVVFRAPAGSFGTFQHELAHAILFWDIPLAPRWFDEGLAALHENTDPEFRGLANPWRQEVLARSHIDQVDLDVLQHKVLPLSLLEFEFGPQPATLAREYLRQVQHCGDLPGLYRTIKAASQRRTDAVARQVEPYERPRPETVEGWSVTAARFAPRPGCAAN